VIAEFCAPQFATHVPRLRRGLRAKLEALMASLNEAFGTGASSTIPRAASSSGSSARAGRHHEAHQAALAAASRSIRAGMVDRRSARQERLRICFAARRSRTSAPASRCSPRVCHKEFGIRRASPMWRQR